jgi:hypothetical protein
MVFWPLLAKNPNSFSLLVICFSEQEDYNDCALHFLQTIESSAYAKLCYVMLKLDEVYIEFIIDSGNMHNEKQKITA